MLFSSQSHVTHILRTSPRVARRLQYSTVLKPLSREKHLGTNTHTHTHTLISRTFAARFESLKHSPLFSQLWLTFAPVADQSAQYLHATLDQVNWLSLVYMVVAIPLSFGTTWMIDSLGLRITVKTKCISDACVAGLSPPRLNTNISLESM